MLLTGGVRGHGARCAFDATDFAESHAGPATTPTHAVDVPLSTCLATFASLTGAKTCAARVKSIGHTPRIDKTSRRVGFLRSASAAFPISCRR